MASWRFPPSSSVSRFRQRINRKHSSFEEYLGWKKLLLRRCRVGIVNRDDRRFEQIVEGSTCRLETYGFSEHATLRASNTMLVSKPGYMGIC